MQTIANGITKLRIGIPEEFTPISFKKSEIKKDQIDKIINPKGKTFTNEDITHKVTTRGLVVTIPLKNDEQIYGLGLQLKSFLQNGKKKTLRVNSDPIYDIGDSHAPVPFYVSTNGYGIMIDTLRNLTFHFGTHKKKAKSNSANIQKNTIANNTEDLYKQENITDSVVIEIPFVEGVDIYFFEGPKMINAIARYNLFSGGGCLPAIWGLGIWYRICGSSNQQQALELVNNIRNSEIPCDVIGFEPGWHTHAYSCSYKWNEERFPQSQEMIDKIKEQHFKINLWEHAFVNPNAPIYNDMYDNSGSHEVWGGLIPDFTDKKSSDTFRNYHEEAFIKNGISGFKLDECDSSDYCVSPWSFPDYVDFPSGLDGEQMHNLLGSKYQEVLHEAYKNHNIRTYGEARSSHLFASSLPFVLYSDLYDHDDFIRGMSNMGFSGLLWSPEVRQCKSVLDLVRRIQSVVFSPQALVNGWMIPNQPWLQFDFDKNIKGEFLTNHEEVTSLCAKFFNLRMSLIPYLYSAFAKYEKEGIPPIRALVCDYDDDPLVRNIDDEFIFGDSILVAPITANENKRKLYLPKGEWINFFTNELFSGNKTYELEIKMNEMLVFVKNHTILPFAKPVKYINENTILDLDIRIYGKPIDAFELYEDDGVSYDYEKGNFNYISISYIENKLSIVKNGDYKGLKYNINPIAIITKY